MLRNHISRVLSVAAENDVVGLLLTDCRFVDSWGSTDNSDKQTSNDTNFPNLKKERLIRSRLCKHSSDILIYYSRNMKNIVTNISKENGFCW